MSEGSLRCNGGVFSMGRGPPSCPRAAAPPRLPPHAPRRPLRRCPGWRQGQLGVPSGRRVPAPLAPDLLETQVGRQPPIPNDRSFVFCLFARLELSISSKPDELTDARAMAPVRHRVFLYQNFLSYDEANHLISLVSATLPPSVHRTLVSDIMKARNLLNFGISSYAFLQARAELKRSAVADNMSGKSTLSEVRTSSGTFLRKGQVRPFLVLTILPPIYFSCLVLPLQNKNKNPLLHQYAIVLLNHIASSLAEGISLVR